VSTTCRHLEDVNFQDMNRFVFRDLHINWKKNLAQHHSTVWPANLMTDDLARMQPRTDAARSQHATSHPCWSIECLRLPRRWRSSDAWPRWPEYSSTACTSAIYPLALKKSTPATNHRLRSDRATLLPLSSSKPTRRRDVLRSS
jgi:hypothetical protein